MAQVTVIEDTSPLVTWSGPFETQYGADWSNLTITTAAESTYATVSIPADVLWISVTCAKDISGDVPLALAAYNASGLLTTVTMGEFSTNASNFSFPTGEVYNFTDVDPDYTYGLQIGPALTGVFALDNVLLGIEDFGSGGTTALTSTETSTTAAQTATTTSHSSKTTAEVVGGAVGGVVAVLILFLATFFLCQRRRRQRRRETLLAWYKGRWAGEPDEALDATEAHEKSRLSRSPYHQRSESVSEPAATYHTGGKF